VNGGDNVFVCLCVCARSEPVNQIGLLWILNAYSSKTVKALDLTRMPLETIHTLSLEYVFRKGAWRKSRDPRNFLLSLSGDMHSHELLLFI